MGLIEGGAIGAISGGRIAGKSIDDAQTWTCLHVPLVQSHVHRQAAWDVTGANAATAANTSHKIRFGIFFTPPSDRKITQQSLTSTAIHSARVEDGPRHLLLP